VRLPGLFRAAPWVVCAWLAGVVLALAAAGVPGDPRPVAALVTAGAAAAVLLGQRLHAPAGRTAWRLMAAGLACSALPGLLGWLLAPLYLVGELLIAAALVCLLRRRHARLERATLIDTSIITLGFAAVTWLYLLGPSATAARVNDIGTLCRATTTAADVALVAVTSALMLGALRRGPAARLLTGSMTALIGSHLLFMWISVHTAGEGRAGALAWIAFSGMLAVAALHPSMRLLSEPAERAGEGLTRGRLAVFAVTSMLAPSVAIAQSVVDDSGHVLISIVAGLIFLLVLLRVAVLVREHEALTARALSTHFEARLGALVRNSSDMVSILDADGSVGYNSPATLQLLGLSEAQAAGMDWAERVHPDDRDAVGRFLAGLAPGESGEVSCRVRAAGGAWRDIESRATNLTGDGAVDGIVLNARDVTERKTLERRLLHQASHDMLTGLPNRMLLRDRVEQALARRRRTGAALAVIFLDLDDFKNVNDSLGHAAGDMVLQVVARRLDLCIRGRDTATRLGGDEFAVLVDDLGDESQAVAVAERILAALAEPVRVAERTVEPTGSLGIAFAADGRDTADDLLRDADAAMYLAKERGKGAYAIFEPAMHAAAVARLELKADLQRAIAADEITLHYQPVVDLRTGEIRAYESLARWTHPVLGPISPAEFIEVAEETGLIVPLGRALLQQACRQAAVFHRACRVGAPLRVSVNVSARQLASDDLVDDVRAAVRDAGIRPCDLILELTESAIMRDLDLAAARLTELREFGVGLAVDDFGTGYSSLNSIRSFPVDRLKIDRSFVLGLHDPRTRALTEMIVELGGLLEMMVVAEGIETQAQARAVLELGCSFAQGYLLQRPAPAEDVLAHLAGHGRWVELAVPSAT
jgi:diguanylate cyclase (GGDEF)-like protein/PAS domain S-box-containing protein